MKSTWFIFLNTKIVCIGNCVLNKSFTFNVRHKPSPSVDIFNELQLTTN